MFENKRSHLRGRDFTNWSQILRTFRCNESFALISTHTLVRFGTFNLFYLSKPVEWDPADQQVREELDNGEDGENNPVHQPLKESKVTLKACQ